MTSLGAVALPTCANWKVELKGMLVPGDRRPDRISDFY